MFQLLSRGYIFIFLDKSQWGGQIDPISIEMVNHLDVNFSLNECTCQLCWKPNNIVTYMHVDSNIETLLQEFKN